MVLGSCFGLDLVLVIGLFFVVSVVLVWFMFDCLLGLVVHVVVCLLLAFLLQEVGRCQTSMLPRPCVQDHASPKKTAIGSQSALQNQT